MPEHEAAFDLDLFGEGQGVGAALVVDSDEALLDVNVRGAIFSHGAQFHKVALWCQLLHTIIIYHATHLTTCHYEQFCCPVAFSAQTSSSLSTLDERDLKLVSSEQGTKLKDSSA